MVKQVPADEWLAPGAQPWLRAEVQRGGRGARILLGPDRHLAFDPDLDARAQGLSLSRRASRTTGSAASSSTAATRHGPATRPIGATSGSERVAGHGSVHHLLPRHRSRSCSRTAEQHAIPSLDGALSPNDRLDHLPADRRPLARPRRPCGRPGRQHSMSPLATQILRLSGDGFADRSRRSPSSKARRAALPSIPMADCSSASLAVVWPRSIRPIQARRWLESGRRPAA